MQLDLHAALGILGPHGTRGAPPARGACALAMPWGVVLEEGDPAPCCQVEQAAVEAVALVQTTSA